MADMSKYYEKAREIDKANGVAPVSGTMEQYYAKAREIDKKNGYVSPTAPATPTTRADGAGVGGNGYEIQMPKLEVKALGAGGGAREGRDLWDRIRNTLSGGIKQSVGGSVDTMGTMYEATQGQRDTLYDQQREWTAHQLARAEADLAAYTADGNVYMAKATQDEVERLRTQLNAYDTVTKGKVQQKATTAARDMAAQVTQSGAQDIERAKEGLGLVGQALVDAGASGVQMLGDAGLGALTGVGGLAPMAFRAFGGGTQKARAEGADIGEQILYGGAQAAKEWVTEKLFSVALPFAKTYGKGSLDDVVEKSIGKAVDRFAKSALGKRALGGGLTLGAAALGEGLEEGLGTFLEWQLPRIYGGDVASFGETLEEAAYNTLVGSLSGLAGGVVTPQVWNYQQTAPQTAQGSAEAAQEAQSAPVTGNKAPAPAEGAQRPQNAPVRLEDTAAAGILMGAETGKQRAGFTSLENAMANQFERETGISIESVESILGGLANGDYNSANWVARIAQDAKDPKMVVVAHELTHHLQTLAPQEYESFRTAVADYFTRAGGKAALTDMMNRYRSAYGAAGQNLSDSAVMDEMAADFTEVLLTDADLFGKFAQQNRTLAERLLDALRAFIEKIRTTFTGRARDAAAQEATGKTLRELEMIAEQWQGVYSAAAAAYGQNANTATQEGDGVVRYKRAGMADKNGEKANAVPTTVGGITEDAYSSGEVAPTINTAPDIRLPNLSEGVNRYSLNTVGAEMDSEGRQLSDGQKAYFANSKVVDESGRLMPVYHGTPAGGFTEFKLPEFLNTLMSAQGAGFYFTDKKNAEQYTKAVNKSVQNGAKKQLYEVYLNITNPLEIKPNERTITKEQFKAILRQGNRGWFKTDWMPFFADGAKAENQKLDFETLLDKYTEKVFVQNNSDGEILSEATRAFFGGDETILNAMKNALGKDGIKFTDSYGDIWVAWSANQIKNIDNLNPTESPDIRYSIKAVGAQYDEKTQSAAPRYSLKTWNASSYVEDREKAAAELARDIGVTEQEAVRYIDDINGVAKMIADDQERLDYEPNLADDASVLKPNAEYKYTVDMSTLCAKRLLFTGTFDMLQRRFPNTAFTGEDLTMLRSMMQEKGMEVACGFCYVESTRREMGPITQEFIRQYTKAQETGEPIKRVNAKGEEVVLKGAGNVTYRADKNFTPTMADLNTTDIDLVKRDHRDVYNAYLAFMNARGQAKPKLLETRAEYKGEILQHFKAKPAVDARNNHGGLRLQSYSDFEVPHMIDMMQIIMDMSRVGLKSQAYTKVPAFAAVFGDTGVKINLSLVAKGSGVDENGNLLFDDVEGMNHEEAFRLRDMYSENVGTILVGKNDDHIRAAMADPRIDFIIPFHKSSWKESMYEALGLTGYDDYTTTQNEKPLDPKRKISNFDPSEYWDFSKSGDENAQIYLEKCRADGRTPKFPQFAGEPGYWKMLIDFKMYDNNGVGSPQQVVAPNFNMEEAYRVLEEYKGGHREFPVAYDVVDEFAARFMMEGRAQLKSTAPLRQMMRDIRMPRLTTVEQDEAEAAGVEAAPVEDTVQMPQLGLTNADMPGTEPLTRQDIARELAWKQRMANEPAAPQTMGEVRLPELSEDMEEAGMGVADFTGNVETVPQEATAEILSALEDLSRDMEAPMETPTDATVRDAESLISAETVEAPQSLKEKAAESWAFFKRKMVDSGDAVTQIGKAISDKYLYPFYNMARASASAGANMIAEEQTDVNGRTVGESLNAIFDPIRAKGEEYYTQFQTYMYDLHNIARMSMDQKAKQEQETAEAALAAYTAEHPKFINMTEAQAQRQADSIDELEAEEAQEYLRLVRWVNRAARMGNKPVFDYDFTAEMSRGRSERLLREHPEFAQYRERVRKYIDNMMQYRVDSGLITQQDADFLREYYPDYIPTYRRQALEDFGAAVKKKRVQIGKTVGRATGGNTKLVPLHEALGKQTMQVVREGSKNRFGARLLQDYAANASNADIARYVRNAEEYESDFSIDTFDSIDDVKPKRGNTFSVYFNGKLYDMTVNNALFEAVEALSPTATEQNTVTKVVHDVNKLYKALITGYNPTFAIRNTVRDWQTAGLYSRDFAAWAKNYPKAMREIFTNGKMWKQYKALGGDFSSVFDYATGTVKKPTTKAGKVANKVQWLNMAFEQAPRLAEFMSVMEKGDGSMESAMDAMLAAADVTVNFGRSGTWGKMLNANYVPFLNPGIQGFDKMVRYATQSKNGKQFLMMAARAAALGIAPSLINALLYHDDEEWEELRDSDKDTNYMFKLKDGLWLKIPKGRELSVLSIAADRVGDALQGEEVDIRATLNTMANQVAPANPLNQNILKAAYDTQLFDPSSPGRTWYGGDIEGQRLQNYAPGERYDSSTDVVSKTIGGVLNLSPKKLNYLADQYTGVVGDIVLPLLTPQAERDLFSKAFTVDSISSNELSSKFYEKSDELTYAKNGGDAVAAVVSRYWNSISSDVSKLYGEIRNVENSERSNSEKKAQVQELQRQINAIQREALATVDQYTAAVESSLFGDNEDAADFAYRETNREVFGAEYALETYNKDVYAKAQEAAKSGVSYEAYYDYYFATKDIESDKDASGKTIPGSKREKVLAEINAMDLTVEQKNALYYANGYAESTLYEAPWYTIQMPRL